LIKRDKSLLSLITTSIIHLLFSFSDLLQMMYYNSWNINLNFIELNCFRTHIWLYMFLFIFLLFTSCHIKMCDYQFSLLNLNILSLLNNFKMLSPLLFLVFSFVSFKELFYYYTHVLFSFSIIQLMHHLPNSLKPHTLMCAKIIYTFVVVVNFNYGLLIFKFM